jgi:hypothetical protein
MKYEKPELYLVGAAGSTIQGHDKGMGGQLDGVSPEITWYTFNAYEADE